MRSDIVIPLSLAFVDVYKEMIFTDLSHPPNPVSRVSTSILVVKVPAPCKMEKKKKAIQRWDNVIFLPVHPTKLVFLR